jgi:carbonic anhydrase
MNETRFSGMLRSDVMSAKTDDTHATRSAANEITDWLEKNPDAALWPCMDNRLTNLREQLVKSGKVKVVVSNAGENFEEQSSTWSEILKGAGNVPVFNIGIIGHCGCAGVAKAHDAVSEKAKLPLIYTEFIKPYAGIGKCTREELEAKNPDIQAKALLKLRDDLERAGRRVPTTLNIKTFVVPVANRTKAEDEGVHTVVITRAQTTTLSEFPGINPHKLSGYFVISTNYIENASASIRIVEEHAQAHGTHTKILIVPQSQAEAAQMMNWPSILHTTGCARPDAEISFVAPKSSAAIQPFMIPQQPGRGEQRQQPRNKLSM